MLRTGACGNVVFWATNDASDIGVTVTMESQEQSAQARSRYAFEVSHESVEVRVRRGSDLHRTFCTDLPKGSRASTSQAVTGAGEISLGPSNLANVACGTAMGTLRATGVTARDGTAFAPILVTSDGAGCVSG